MIRVLNVAGPREGESPGIYQQVLPFLRDLFSSALGADRPDGQGEDTGNRSDREFFRPG